MPAGKWQLPLWQHQLAINNEQAQLGVQAMQAVLDRYDLVPATRKRIEEACTIAQLSRQSVDELMQDVGITARFDEQFVHLKLGAISEYYHHILQDWAWGDVAVNQRLEPILRLYHPETPGSLMALGAGAGRLSWELHKIWDAQLTLATDINPLLLAASQRLIVEQKAFAFYELNSFPQIEKARSACYTLSPPQDTHNKRAHWHAMAADVWHMPIKANSLDIIVTAWFIDVHGGDNRTLISLIQRWLKPGGVWINSGPLLYPKNSPLECKYDRDELMELIRLAGLEFAEQTLSEHGHLMSPINVRKQSEQVWTFLARKPSADHVKTENFNAFRLPPPWIIFHDLPVPNEFTRPADSHPLIDQILAFVDGKHSIDSICAATADLFPEGLEPRSTLVEILGELFNLNNR